jgi:hypothetical protein
MNCCHSHLLSVECHMLGHTHNPGESIGVSSGIGCTERYLKLLQMSKEDILLSILRPKYTCVSLIKFFVYLKIFICIHYTYL